MTYTAVFTVICGFVLAARVLTFDPPSGYSMGTGDNPWTIVVLGLGTFVGAMLWVFGQ
jgi:hypothetical protein